MITTTSVLTSRRQRNVFTRFSSSRSSRQRVSNVNADSLNSIAANAEQSSFRHGGPAITNQWLTSNTSSLSTVERGSGSSIVITNVLPVLTSSRRESLSPPGGAQNGHQFARSRILGGRRWRCNPPGQQTRDQRYDQELMLNVIILIHL